ncbi:MAG: hypothetical protein O3B43_02885 [Chloroflexi bacterium]|nr:hypothetical protein [Chloroflexota bacterium]
MNFGNLISRKNLRLAWNRILTAKNVSYKNLFRHHLDAYSLEIEENLESLRTRLRDGVYKPISPVRIFSPTKSGLQRPITLLAIEDQIVLQGLANLFADKIRARRRHLEGESVYSYLLNEEDNIFFVRD